MTNPQHHTAIRLPRGFATGIAAAAIAFPIPWIIGHVLLNVAWFAHDTHPSDRAMDSRHMIQGGWLAAYLLSSITFASFFCAFSTYGRRVLKPDAIRVSGFATATLIFSRIADGPRTKLEPSFGTLGIDLLVLTLPAILCAAMLVLMRISHFDGSLKPYMPCPSQDGG